MEGFLQDLAGCKAVIANAGFSLVSEALHLANLIWRCRCKTIRTDLQAYYLEKTGYGRWPQDLGKEQIESFLFNLPVYAENLASYPRQGNTALLAKLDELISSLTSAAVKR